MLASSIIRRLNAGCRDKFALYHSNWLTDLEAAVAAQVIGAHRM